MWLLSLLYKEKLFGYRSEKRVIAREDKVFHGFMEMERLFERAKIRWEMAFK